MKKKFFQVVSYRCIIEGGQAGPYCHANMKVAFDGKEEIGAADKSGPIETLWGLLIKILALKYPLLKKVELIDFDPKVYNINISGAGAPTKTMVKIKYNGSSVKFEAQSLNLIDSGFQAIVEGLNACLKELYG